MLYVNISPFYTRSSNIQGVQYPRRANPSWLPGMTVKKEVEGKAV
jgi:hypothetical protein